MNILKFNFFLLSGMRNFYLLLFLSISTKYTYAGSDTLQARVTDTIPQSFLNLRIANDSISNNDKLNEEIVDMVNVDERDRKVPTPYTTHQELF